MVRTYIKSSFKLCSPEGKLLNSTPSRSTIFVIVSSVSLAKVPMIRMLGREKLYLLAHTFSILSYIFFMLLGQPTILNVHAAQVWEKVKKICENRCGNNC